VASAQKVRDSSRIDMGRRQLAVRLPAMALPSRAAALRWLRTAAVAGGNGIVSGT
jgi:hypothetical protein